MIGSTTAMRIIGLLGLLMFSARALSADPSEDGEVRTKATPLKDGTTRISRHAKTFLELTIRNPDGTQRRRTIWHLGPKGELESCERFDGADKLVYTELFIYLTPDKLAEARRFHPDGTPWMTAFFVHDKDGRHTRTRILDPSGREVPPNKWSRSD